MNDKIPDNAYLFIIGAMKCGTSSLYGYLESHPEICPATVKEPEYFSGEKNQKIKVDKYNNLWEFDNRVHKYAMEASTGYTKYPVVSNVPRNIYEYKIKPKFIYIVRDPYERIESHYNFMQKDSAWKEDLTSDHLINTSNYYIQLEQYRKYFTKESIYIIDFDDLKKKPEEMLIGVYKFLGISSEHLPKLYGKSNMTPTTELERIIKNAKYKKLYKYIPKSLKKLARIVFSKIGRPIEKRRLSDKEKSYIYKNLEDDMRKLSHEYNINVDKWGFKSS